MIKNLEINADIRAIQKKLNLEGKLSPQEARLLQEYAAFSRKFKTRGGKLRCEYESKLQQFCHNLIKDEYQYKKDVRIDFVQIDNGGKMSIRSKVKKRAEGTKKGFFDNVIFARKRIKLPNGFQFKSKQFFPEFKRIGAPSDIDISPEQRYWHDLYKEWGESVHYCNNTVYFQAIIMKEIEEFLK